jgi:ketosteroid isomerase-like protein
VSDLKELVDHYLTAWNTPDDAARRAIIADVFTDDGVFVDPFMEVQGHDAVNGGIGAVLAQFPGHALTRIGDIDHHHGTARFRWQIAPADGGESVVEGLDVAVTENGKLTGVYGFIDKMPAA